MDQNQIINLVQEALFIIIQISGPVMIIGLVVGVAVALLQALTQVQEMTLAFVPKIFAIFLAMFFLFPLFISILSGFMDVIADQIIAGDLPSDM
ncbi:MAG: flagellar biosynthetic protein FliQ [Micavibrio sp.]|nr:flagellar biosynthetic protein FliQ [Micavibrio sp.]HCK32493.1 flagellar biosynthetic protein FliQ [Rhodospirillaceae bacterium]